MEPTGDNTDLFLYMALAVISMAAVIRVSKKIKDDGAYINSFNADGYSVIIREEEKKGYRFMDTAKDIAKMERNVVLGYFVQTDEDGNPCEKLPKIIINIILLLGLAGAVNCLVDKEWTWGNFLHGVYAILILIAAECVLSIPLYFLGKKFEWIRKNRGKALFILFFILLLLITIFDNLF